MAPRTQKRRSTSRRSAPGRRLIAHDRKLGARLVAGTDEAGRGALAGPLVAAAVCLDLERLTGPTAAYLSRLDDSKKLTAATREELYRNVVRVARSVTVRLVGAASIDDHGIQRANHGGMVAALRALDPVPEVMLVDGYRLAELPTAHQIIKGDATSAAIAAAAIVAKVTRDRLMARLEDADCPYAFASHKGYGTDEHRAELHRHGPGPHHRRSFLSNIDSYGPPGAD